jgi:hypothetical protein
LTRAPIGALRASVVYLLIAIVFTWPLALGLARDIPWDLGDSLLNCWIIGWDADHVLRFLSGDFRAMHGLWNGNIFYPEPLTLAYSEHLFAQAIQILPVYALTHNIILCYNVLFLSTFVLSGLGMFLFARTVTGSPRAAFVAGLIYAFAPLRVPQFAHLQVISSQWMPFALFGLRRYFDESETSSRVSRAALVSLGGATLALIAQNLSCGYFLMFFAPCVVAYVLFEIARRQRWSDMRMWMALAMSAILVAAITIPFLWPYVELRRLGFPPRAYTEVASYSADVYSYWTSPAESRIWGHTIRAFPKPEGDLFPSVSALVLATIGLIVGIRSAWLHSRKAAFRTRFHRLIVAVAAVCGLYFTFVLLILTGHGFNNLGPMPISVKNIVRNFQILAGASALLLALSARARLFAREWLRSDVGIAVMLTLATFLLSLGPEIRTMGRTLQGTAPYAFLYWHVPGFDGLRVPARYGMLTMMFLSVVAAFGVRELDSTLKRGWLIASAAGVLVVLESFAAPIVINGIEPETEYAPPPPHMMVGQDVPPVYRYLKDLPSQTVVAEFPFGDWTYEVRYVFYSMTHWHPLINGYSGTFPLGYSMTAAALRRPEEDPQKAWDTLRSAGATHIVVHERFYLNGSGSAVTQWLLNRGAHLVAEFDGDKIFSLK